MIGFNKIILTTDLSANADAATPYAVELARKFDGEIYLVHVFEDSIYYIGASGGEAMPYDPVKWIAAAQEAREKQLKALAEKIAAEHKVKATPVLRQGQPANETVTFAGDLNADCIVIATHGLTGFSRLMFGSVAEKIVRLSPCPVLSIRPKNIAEASGG
jgi:nucleotide-binding universal stress UspA family protein